MDSYDKLLIPEPFGLQNTGVICYFNSFLQALCACSSFTKVVMQNKEYLSETNVGSVIIEFVEGYINNNVNSLIAQKILQALCNDLKKRRPNIRFGSGQESAHEVFILLLDMMEPLSEKKEEGLISSLKSPITKLFLHKGVWNLFCKKCNKIISKEIDYGVIFDMHHIDAQYLNFN